MEKAYERIAALGVIPVIAIEDVAMALPLADALAEGGLPGAEITFRTEAAAAVIERISRERPDMLVGAGTILTTDNLMRAVECGASFGVAPGFSPAIVARALDLKFPFSPGVMTPTDIESALSRGVKLLKFFPAGAAGGVAMLKSIAAPYLHTGVRFIPTGGINQANLSEHFALKAVVAVGGTWIATADDIAAKRWNQICDNCRNAVAVVNQLKSAAAAAH